MPSSNPCPKCQRPVDGSAPHELCPACLLEAMLPNGDSESLAEPPATLKVDPAPVTERLGERIDLLSRTQDQPR